MRVLLVDDEGLILVGLERVVKKFDWDFDRADCYSKACEHLLNNKYDIIICDHNMGQDGDGLDVYKLLRHTIANESTIFISHSWDYQTYNTICGKDEHYYSLKKSFDQEEFEADLVWVLEKYSSRPEVISSLEFYKQN